MIFDAQTQNYDQGFNFSPHESAGEQNAEPEPEHVARSLRSSTSTPGPVSLGVRRSDPHISNGLIHTRN